MKTATEASESAAAPQPAGWIDRLARRAFLAVVGRFDRTPLRLELPEGGHIDCGGQSGEIPTAVLRIRHPRFFRRVLLDGEIGFGEGYMSGDWTTPDLTALLGALIDNLEHIPDMSGSRTRALAFNALKAFNRFAHWRRRNTPRNSRRNIHAHYDLSNEFYALWLDETMTYSSAWFDEGDDLRSAQENKYHRLCRKLRLRPGMRVLEIGCGWGGFSIHAAREFGVSVTAITISEAQYEKARQRVREAGMQDRVEVLLQDYRDVEGTFDAIASIEMLEAVGHQFLRNYFDQCHRLLKPTGCLGLQVILCPDSRYDSMRGSVDWIKKHIFPGGQLPSVKALMDSASATGDLYLQHLESFGLHYARTLRDWRERFNRQRDAVLALGFDEVFVRKWNYYLAYCEAAFATRNINVAQMILTRPNNTAFALEC
jgi:cyclopropane-fatty-acyl-phospholipid synthase